eukprot:5444711-Ditylum_brightwellii.AAC.1
MSHQVTGTGQDVTNGATGGIIENARATQTKFCSSQQKKKGLMYDIINKEKKRRHHGSTKKWKQKQQSKIRQYFAPAGDTDTDKETDSDDDT